MEATENTSLDGAHFMANIVRGAGGGDEFKRMLSSDALENVSSDCRVSFYGAHTSLTSRERADLVNHLLLHLSGAEDLQANLEQAQWRLRSVTFTEIHSVFATIATSAKNYSEQLRLRIKDFGGVAPRSTSAGLPRQAGTDAGPSFPLCIENIGTHVSFLSTLAHHLSPFVERAHSGGDYATSTSITKLLTTSRRLTELVSENIPHPDITHP